MTELNTKPTIAILCKTSTELCERWFTPFQSQGYEIKFIQPSLTINAANELRNISGLLLPGGNSNIHPAFTGRQQHIKDTSFDYAQDHSAIALAREAYKLNLPTLGICRGMQGIVVAHGGIIDLLPTHEKHGKGYEGYCESLPLDQKKQAIDERVHAIEFKEGGQLKRLFKHLLNDQNAIDVNSVHNEGITLESWTQDLESKLTIEATCPDDGVIEIISAKNKNFYIGTQAHFEIEGPLHDALFTEFYKNIELYSKQTNQH